MDERTEAVQNFKRYLHGEPINEDLAALRDGHTPEVDPGYSQIPNSELTQWAIDKPLTREDRIALQEIRNHPGWLLFIRLQKKALQVHEKSAIKESKVAPLTNSSKVAAEWAMVQMYERAIVEIAALVDAEIRQIEGDERR